ncbi:MAG: hypothetical protein HRU11_03230 [Parvularculaceae bacterium]|nr:hypothetical protein [Parvularculaceae bacterium]
MSLDPLIAKHRLSPHPFEGWWRALDESAGPTSEALQLLGALDEAGWHRFPAQVTYRLEEGGPVAITVSDDGEQASARRLVAVGDTLTVEPHEIRAVSCLGRAALLHLTVEPARPLTDRELMPDDWFPKG